MDTKDAVSAQIPDWSREEIQGFWDPGRKLLRTIRRYQSALIRGGMIGWVCKKYWLVPHRFWSIVTQCEIHPNTEIAGGLRIIHPNGIVIHPGSKIGPNCLIFHQVTLAGSITLGGHVDIGAGAKIMGPVSIGDHARVGANAVVTKNVPTGITVAGIPAKPIETKRPNEPTF